MLISLYLLLLIFNIVILRYALSLTSFRILYFHHTLFRLLVLILYIHGSCIKNILCTQHNLMILFKTLKVNFIFCNLIKTNSRFIRLLGNS
jgi:hypothetical protein